LTKLENHTGKGKGSTTSAETEITDERVTPEGLALLKMMNDMYTVAIHDGRTMYMKRTVNHQGEKEILALTRQDVFKFHESDRIEVLHYTASGKTWKDKSLAEYWFQWPHKNRKEQTVFTPRPMTPKQAELFFNLYPGLSRKAKKGQWGLIRAHLRDIWCNGDKKLFDSIINWMAHLVQKPWEKPGVALVIIGGKGTGKSTIFECIFKPILGSLYTKISHRNHLTGNFNAHLANKLLVVNEEAFFHGDYEATEVVKSMITEELMQVEPKGVDVREVRTSMRVAFVSNNQHVVSASPDERRYLVLDISADKAQDHEYFKALRHEINNGGIEAFLHYLMEWKIDMDNLRTPPRTKALFNQMVHSFTPFQRWAYEELLHINDDDPCIRWDSKVASEDLYQNYNGWRQNLKDCDVRTGANRIADAGAITKEIHQLFGFPRTRVGNQRGFILPSREDARGVFEKHVKMTDIWDDLEVDDDGGFFDEVPDNPESRGFDEMDELLED